MAYVITTDIFCDGFKEGYDCGNTWIQGPSIQGKQCRLGAKAIAVKAGWSITHKRHLCPPCKARFYITKFNKKQKW